MSHVTAATIASEYGFTARHWTRQAATGNIPGAYQPSGEGGRWVFDREVFRRWWATKQREVSAWRGSTNAGKRGGAVPSVRGKNTEKALEQVIEESLRNAYGNG